MATRTSSQAGNTNSAPFAFGSAVNAGDVLICNHDVTIDGNISIGLAACPDTPATAPTAAATTGGSLPAYTFNICYACVDANGTEAWGISGTTPVVTDATNNAINVTLPVLPAGVSAYNIYYSDGPSIIYRMGTGSRGVGAGVAKVTSYTSTRRTSPGGLYVSDTKTVTVAAGVALTVKGSIALDGGKLIFAAGSSLSCDPVTSGVLFRIGLGDYYDMSNTQFKTTGTSGARVTVSAASGTVAAFSVGATGNSRGATNLDLAYADFTRFGDATTPLVSFNLDTPGTSPVIDNCTFTACGRIGTATSIPATKGLSITNSTWSGGLDSTYGLDLRLTADTVSGTPTRTLSGCVFDLGAKVSPSGTTVSYCLLPDGIIDPGGGTTSFTGISNSLIWMGKGGSASIGGLAVYGPLTDCYILGDSSYTLGNFHILLPRTTDTHSGLIFDANAVVGEDNSDGLYSATSCTVTLENSIVCRNDVIGSNTGACTLNPNPSMVLKVRHCSAWAFNALVSLGDLSFGAGTLAEYKSNLVRAPSTDTHWHVNYKTQQATPTFANAMTAAGVTNNGSFGLATGAEGNGYNTNNTDGTPGTGDVFNVDPGWVDPARNLRKWAIDRGHTASTGTTESAIRTAYADGVAALKADFATRFDDLMGYVRDGFAPTNSAYAAAAHDGTTIGAVAYVAAGGVPLIGGGLLSSPLFQGGLTR